MNIYIFRGGFDLVMCISLELCTSDAIERRQRKMYKPGRNSVPSFIRIFRESLTFILGAIDTRNDGRPPSADRSSSNMSRRRLSSCCRCRRQHKQTNPSFSLLPSPTPTSTLTHSHPLPLPTAPLLPSLPLPLHSPHRVTFAPKTRRPKPPQPDPPRHVIVLA